MIRILIADDHAVVRQGLIQIVSDTSDMVVSGEASSGREVLAKISEDKYDVVVLDIAMPDFSGLDVLNEIKRTKPELSVLMLSIYPEEQYAVRALKAGACGYLTKKVAPKELIRAIRKVYGGGKYVTAYGEGFSTQPPRHLPGLIAIVDTDIAEVIAEERFHLAPCALIEGLAGP